MNRKTNISGKVAVITGAGSGIGKAIAIRLAEEGVTLALLGGRNTDKLNAVKNEVEAHGSRCLSIPGDLTDGGFIEQGVNAVIEKFGQIDILINNAGSAFSSPFEKVTKEQFDEIISLDVRVPFFLTQASLPHLRKSQSATIVNIASVVAHTGYPLQSAYSMAKHALLGFSQSLARELYKENIRVHVISPGGVFTEMVKLTRPDLTGDDMILPEDVAEAVAFLLTNRGNAVIDEISLHRINKEPFS